MGENKSVVVRWWLTSLPLRFLGMSGEPFAIVVLIPMFPFPFFLKLVGWILVINLIMSWFMRKNLTTFLLYLKRQFFNNRRRIYSPRNSKRRFRGFY